MIHHSARIERRQRFGRGEKSYRSQCNAHVRLLMADVPKRKSSKQQLGTATNRLLQI